jgi:Superinfection immunity protein
MVAASTGSNAGSAAGITVGLIVAVVAYWLPSIIAWWRHVPAKAQVVIVNLFLGWTVIGWVLALVMAFRRVPPATETQ